MKKTFIKILTLTLAVLMLLSTAVACKKNEVTLDANDSQNSTDADGIDNTLEIKVYALNGTTALGMAKMIEDSDSDDMNYNIELHTAADAITGAIVKGECAIAALPTNVAVKLFNKSEGKLQLLALNTLGVLYLLEDGTQNVTCLDDLKGKTIYLPGAGSNPEYITAALLSAAGLEIGKDVTLDTTTYNSPDALQTAYSAGLVPLAVLPEPKVTVALNSFTGTTSAKVALDLTEEWEAINGKNTLVQGCLVVNTKFASDHPQEIAKFLADYKDSVEYVSAGTDESINTIVNAGVLPKAAIAKKALPNCNICYIAGADMKPVMNTFAQKIFEYDPSSVGGKLPADNFYYISDVSIAQ